MHHRRLLYNNDNGDWHVSRVMINTTLNNISAISWLSVLLVEETGGPGENHRPVASHRQTLSHNAVLNISRLGDTYIHL
jgi:hypothetical protein